MPWVATFLAIILLDSASTAQRPTVLGLTFVLLLLSAWSAWSDDRRKRR
jgi:hypothetical protein